MIALAAFALVQSAPIVRPMAPPQADYSRTTDGEFCRIMRQITANVTPDLPRMVDSVTRVDGMSVFCGLRTVATNKYLLVSMSAMQEGWQARKQEQWNRIICDNAAFGVMARRGWRFAHNMTFQSGERITQEARC